MFQSTRPQGARPAIQDASDPEELFQSTRPQGARRVMYAPCLRIEGFNPRARRGRDLDNIRDKSVWEFQSTRPQGARLRSACILPRSSCFNPRARRGRDRLLLRSCRGHDVSIHAPARGATSYRKYHCAKWRFQSTRPQGARPGRRSWYVPVSCFNPRARRGRDRQGIGVFFYSKVSIHAPARGATGGSITTSDMWRFNPRARTGRDVLFPI